MKTIQFKLLFFLFAFGLLLSVASCEKCHECIAYEDYFTNQIYYYESHCAKGSGSSKEIEQWEADFKAKYAGYYVICRIRN